MGHLGLARIYLSTNSLFRKRIIALRIYGLAIWWWWWYKSETFPHRVSTSCSKFAAAALRVPSHRARATFYGYINVVASIVRNRFFKNVQRETQAAFYMPKCCILIRYIAGPIIPRKIVVMLYAEYYFYICAFWTTSFKWNISVQLQVHPNMVWL